MALNASSMMRKMKMEGGLYCNEGWAKTKAKEALGKEILREFAKFSHDEKEEQAKFDTETKHGIISDKEAEWEKRYGVH